MNSSDISPFFRSTVGFDRLFDQLERNLDNDSTWPPYDVVKTAEDNYQITVAVPGFRQEDIDIESHDSLLTVKADRRATTDDVQYLHRGIGNRPFNRTFQLAEYVNVSGARLRDGLLTIELRREVPEAMRPRKIEIERNEGETVAINNEAA